MVLGAVTSAALNAERGGCCSGRCRHRVVGSTTRLGEADRKRNPDADGPGVELLM